MTTFRFHALADALSRTPKHVEFPSDRASNYYAVNVFTQEKMREYLPSEAYKSVMSAINHGTQLDRQLSNQVASSMKDWALTKQVTHYTHWFQPLTGATAEKHDAFFSPISGGRAIEKFDGDNLVQQEPDASSFPNGGIRNTFDNPAKGQQLDDHYFGSIPERASAFMREYEIEALKLGIPVTTRHNEVAPNQFECAPMFEEANLANDHNLLLMDLLEKIARKHDFRILLHEKPFPSLNGSGKHNNWSLGTNTGVNLLAPGKNPKTNLRFLTFFINTIKAIHDNADILRSSIASAGNDHRLGANEAPPAIISVFIGSQLTQMLDRLEKSIKAGKMTPEDKTELKLSIGKIPQIMLDNTDRNRTSPFAFTGNKFEFRAVGSAANCGSAMIALNVIVAKQLQEFKKSVDLRMEKGDKKDEAILKELQKLIKESKKIRFEGNGYGDEWVKEAEKRGLSNLKDTPRALKVMIDKKTKDLFSELGVFSNIELEAR